MAWLFNTTMLGSGVSVGVKGTPANGVSFTQRCPNGVMGIPYSFASKGTLIPVPGGTWDLAGNGNVFVFGRSGSHMNRVWLLRKRR